MTSIIGSKGTKSKSSGITTSEPWEAQQGSLKNIYARAEQLFQDIPEIQQYGGSFYAGTNQDYNALRGYAGRGEATQAATGEVARTAGGYYLNRNPHLESTFRRASSAFGEQFANEVGGQIGGRFGSSGRSGSAAEGRAMDLAQRNYGRRLEDLSSSIYGGNYERERERQLTAAGMAGSVSQARMGELMASGQLSERFEQQDIAEQRERFQYDRDQGYDRLARYSEFIGQPISTQYATESSKTSGGASGLMALF